MVPQVKLFSFIFWENWRHQKDISKLTDLYQQKPEEPSNSFEAFTSQGSPSLLHCTFSTDETLAFDVQMKSIGQKSLLTRRSFLSRFLPPSFFLKNKKIGLKVWYSIFRFSAKNRKLSILVLSQPENHTLAIYVYFIALASN